MTWLHKFFGLFFIPADSQAKSAQQLISTVLPFTPYIFHAQNQLFPSQIKLKGKLGFKWKAKNLITIKN